MKKSVHGCLAVFLCLPVMAFTQQDAAPAGNASQPPALTPHPVPTAAPDAAEGHIALDVVVTDKSGKPVSGLEEKDFTLLDNNRPGKILSFRAIDGAAPQAAQPAQVLLLLDTVNLGIQAVDFEQQEMERFLRQNGGHLAFPVSILLFTDTGVKVQSQPSTDGNALAAELNAAGGSLRSIGRAAGSWGDIERFQLSLRMVTAIAKNLGNSPGRKLLIWVGPGWPLLDSVRIETSSKGEQQLFSSVVELSTTLRESNVALYSISSGMPGQGTFIYESFLKGVKLAEKTNPPNLGLKVLAVQSGGRVLGPDNDLASQINSCVQDGGAFYSITFDPPRADRPNEYHDLKVQIDKQGLAARTNTGYYNQPSQQPDVMK